MQKLLDQRIPNLDGGFNTKSGTRKADKSDSHWQGKVRGKTKHTFGVDDED